MEKELFNRFKSLPRSPEPADLNAVSRISEGTAVKGEICSRSDLRVDGEVDGKLQSDGRVVVGEKALMKGKVICNDLDLWGTMDGDIFVKNLLSVKSSASITGTIHVRKLQVEIGAAINGTCQMITDSDFEEPGEGGESQAAEVE